MTDSVFDIALEKRFTDSAEITTINVTSADMMLIRDSATGVVMRVSFATLADVRVGTNGDVSMYSGNSSYLSLSGIVFQL